MLAVSVADCSVFHFNGERPLIKPSGHLGFGPRLVAELEGFHSDDISFQEAGKVPGCSVIVFGLDLLVLLQLSLLIFQVYMFLDRSNLWAVGRGVFGLLYISCCAARLVVIPWVGVFL